MHHCILAHPFQSCTTFFLHLNILVTFVQESAKAVAELARDFAPEIECKWGDAGLEEIMADNSILGVAVVLAGQVQVWF
jgi:hypothetical protein